MNAEDPDPLDHLLAQWQPHVETPPDFRREVWRRIAVENRDPGWVERLASWLLRPKREAVVFTAAVVLAIAWGITHPQEPVDPHDAYVMSISPFDSGHFRSGRP
ncbi:MAG: hypothetical protein JNM65_15090 [Verrucomicrobiaceae bacterium]|nr:hypothetical protein [Verrucomicrobiaceae bacterium]